MGKRFRAYDLNQQMLLPPDLREWVPEGHLARFVSELVEQLDLSTIIKPYDEGEQRGQPPYHPELMVKLLIYGYCTGRMSSRKLEQASYEEVAVRMLTGNQQPDHASIAEFRRRHLLIQIVRPKPFSHPPILLCFSPRPDFFFPTDSSAEEGSFC